MPIPDMNIEQWPLDRVIPYARNPRDNRAAVSAVKASIKEFGFRQPIVVDKDGVIVAGHTRYLAAQQLELDSVPVHVATELTPIQIKAYRLADNRTADNATWDDDLLKLELQELQQDDFDLDLTGFDEADLARLIDQSLDTSDVDAEPQIDKAEELREKWGVVTGQLWQLGDHRLICGDCTDLTVVTQVMDGEKAGMVFTDPPYGHNNNNNGDLIHNREAALGKPKTASSAARPIANDGPEANDLVRQVFSIIADLILAGGCCCCCCGGGGPDPQFARWSLWLDEVIPFKMCVIWDKGGLGMGWHYRRNWECILIAEKPGAACKWYGGHDVPNIIRDIGKIIPSAEQHPTEKPVALAEWFIKLHSLPGDVIYDPFLGSGTTMIAAQRLGRCCFGVEIDPIYTAVALQRFFDATGIKPKLLSG